MATMDRFDYVIVGAGSAGCVLANRLTEDAEVKVLVLEAGPKDNNLWIHMPAALTYNLCHDRYNWYYHTEPQPHLDGRVMYWPRGRVLGGSSSLNAMVYIRGHALDYDRWSKKEGATGWNYFEVLPYFKRAETRVIGGDAYRGASGPLYVSTASQPNPLFKAFIEAGQQAGGRSEAERRREARIELVRDRILLAGEQRSQPPVLRPLSPMKRLSMLKSIGTAISNRLVALPGFMPVMPDSALAMPDA